MSHHSFPLRWLFSLQCLIFTTGAFCFSAETQSAAGKIAFASDRTGDFEIYVMNADGSDLTRLTNSPALDHTPVFSKDGSRIAFVSDRDGNPELYIMNADGSGVTRLTNAAGHDGSPAFHPNGGRIVFVSDRDHSSGEVYVLNLDGGVIQRITNNEISEDEPVFNADGSLVVYAADIDVEGSEGQSNWEIFSLAANGSGSPVRLTNNPAYDHGPAIRPDGSQIAFISTRDDTHTEIYALRIAGGGVTRLTQVLGQDDYSPAYNPDGTKIAFSSLRTEDNSNIYVMASDGANPVQITSHSGEDVDPSWAPGEVPPTLSISNTNLPEGAEGTSEMTFEVLLSSPSSEEVSVRFATADGTATAGVDYIEASGQLVFATGETRKLVTVSVQGDSDWESAETFLVQLSEPQGATLSEGRASGAILNDDPIPTVPGRIVYASYHEGDPDIWVMNPDGTGAYNITNTPTIPETDPAWSPDGMKIAFVAGVDGFADIFVMNADGSEQTNLTNSPGIVESNPTWSPDGKQIAFQTNFHGDSEIYSMNADGSGARNLTNNTLRFGYNDATPSWSPSGLIFFAGVRDGRSSIISMNPDGSDQRILTNKKKNVYDHDHEPALSPDGSLVVFMRELEEQAYQWDIMLMNADGSGLVNLTDHPAGDLFPSFNPDGTKIVFTSNRAGNLDLYTIPVPAIDEPGFTDGRARTRASFAATQAQASAGEPTRLTATTGSEDDPDWHRQPVAVVPPVAVSVGKSSAGEGNGTKSVAFTVRLASAVKQRISLQIATENGSALAGVDYLPVRSILSFAPGQRTKKVQVRLKNDVLDEEHETFTLRVSSLANALLTQAQGTILDDDRPPQLSVKGLQSIATEATFTVTLPRASERPVTVDYSTADGTAKSTEDYTSVSGTLTFAPGETTKTVSVSLQAGASGTKGKTFFLRLDNASNARVGRQPGRVVLTL